MSDLKSKSDFLKFAIEDTQSIIKFIDTKTGYSITILGAYVAVFFSSIEKFVKYFNDYSFGLWISLIVFCLLLLLSIIITGRIIKPASNPIKNIVFDESQKLKLEFFLSPNIYGEDNIFPFHNSDKFKLKKNANDYISSINSADENDVIRSLSFEFLKLSFIRNIKNDRFYVLLWFLAFTTIAFFIYYIVFTIETQQIIDYKQYMSQHCHCY